MSRRGVKPMQKERIKDLVFLAQSGDQEAFSELLKAYDPLITSTVSKFRVEGMLDADSEDLRQEAILAFYSALLSYDPNISEVEFGLYAKVCICNRLVSQVRIIKKHIANSMLAYSDEDLVKYVADDGDPSKSIVEQEAEKSLMKLISDNLSDMENRVFEMYVSGMSAAEMARRLDVSEKSVSNTVYRIRKKLKSVLQK
jgi:RNA polymerase sporulation-specific sigma factor